MYLRIVQFQIFMVYSKIKRKHVWSNDESLCSIRKHGLVIQRAGLKEKS